MIGATARAEQFYERSGSESTKPSRKGFSLLGGGENPCDHLTPEERRASLVQKWKKLQGDLAEAKRGKNKRQLRAICQEITETGLAINAIRPKRASSRDVTGHFVDVCREMMTKPQFNAIMDEANRRLRATSKGEA